jgi:CheY-like chemotaxis protein
METFSVLVVEDDEVDMRTLERAFARRGMAGRLRFARDGASALELLKAGDYALPRPCIVLLDQNLPRMSGLDFLEQLRLDPRLPFVDVYVLTASRSDEEMRRAMRLGAKAFLQKDQLGTDFGPLFEMLSAQGHLQHLPPRAV